MHRLTPLTSLLIAGVVCWSCGPDGNAAAPRASATRPELQGIVRGRTESPLPEQLERRERSLAQLQVLGVPVLKTLPVSPSASEVDPRSTIEVARRAFALTVCAVKGESRDAKYGYNLTVRYQVADWLTPLEAEFIKDAAPNDQSYVDHSWGYECVHVMLWALGHVDDLGPPSIVSDAAESSERIAEAASAQVLAASALPISTAKLLDAADLYYHLHWSAVELRLQGKFDPQLNESVTKERLRALNWLVRNLDQEWDDVTTHT